MKYYPAHILMIVGLSLNFLGCKKEATEAHHAKALEIDARYNRTITFEPIGITIPIKRRNVFVRIDDPVLDMDQRQQEILQELGITSANVRYSNSAIHGRSMHLTFVDGKQCTFIWVLERPDKRITQISFEHEKYHALCRVAPSGITPLSEAIQEKGFDIDLRDYNEELSASIVQIVSLHLLGVSLEEISGSDLVTKAREVLKRSRSNKSIQATPEGAPD
jgi:hypothetical protein